MDMGFFRHAEMKSRRRAPATLDYGVLVTTLAAYQAKSATARAEMQCRAGNAAQDGQPLIELLLGLPGWRAAIALRRGCFSRAVARPHVNVA